MKSGSLSRLALLSVAVSSVFMLAVTAAPAQKQLVRQTLDGGGGRSESARYVLTGTIGQPDAAPALTGTRYRMAIGFWTRVSGNTVFRDGFESP